MSDLEMKSFTKEMIDFQNAITYLGFDNPGVISGDNDSDDDSSEWKGVIELCSTSLIKKL